MDLNISSNQIWRRKKSRCLKKKLCLPRIATLFETCIWTRRCGLWHETELARILFWVSDSLSHDLELCVRALCSPKMKKKEKKAEARRCSFRWWHERQNLRNESSKEDIYVIGCMILLLKPAYKSLRLWY